MHKVFYATGGLFAALLLLGLIIPRHGSFVVAGDVDANPATVFALLNDPRRKRLWLHDSEIDPNARVRYSGPQRGAGATISWDGAIAGSGTETITESRPYEFVATVINAGESSESHTWYELTDTDSGTHIDWGFSHDYGFNLVGRYMSLLLTGVMRQNYEKSLENLKILAESLPTADFAGLDIERLVVEPMQIAYKSIHALPEPAKMSAALGSAYFEIMNFMDANNLQLAGAPLSIARSFTGAKLNFDAGIPVSGTGAGTPDNQSGIRLGQTYGGEVLRVKHTGSYRQLNDTHRRIAAYLAALGIERSGDSWESYVSDPSKVEESKLLTYVYYPIRDKR
ncbi:MAG TPA: SRPBCC family protein [Woeseiaceae bacterium]|nr:SRPBCC family protein [Woeseiaceae bacterium]